MVNEIIAYRYKRKRFEESKKISDRSFKTLSEKWRAPKIKRVALPNLTLYPLEWTYLVSNTKHPHTITLEEFRKKELKKGDKIYFERGQIYNFTEYTVLVDNVTFGSYGSGADPVFLGSTAIGSQTWTSEGSSQFSTPWSNDFKWLFVDGIAAKLAETPWYKITSQADGTHLTATTLNGAWGSSVSGAQALIREWYFTYSHARNVTAYSTGQITIDIAVRTGLTEFTFKLYNQRQFISEEFEFFYDSSAHILYYRSGGSSPAGTDIRICTEDFAVEIDDGVSGFVCDGIEFTQYKNAAIQGFEAHGFELRNCNINNIRTNAVFIYGASTNVIIEDNTISKCGCNGLYFGGLVNPTIQGNTITTIGRERTSPFALNIGASFSTWQQTTASAIVFTYDLFNISTLGVDGGIVTLNTISDCGYCGINFTGSLDEVSYNRIDGVMHDVEDGGGIYCIAQPELPAFGTETIGTVITKNIVTNVHGVYDNCPLSHPDMNSWGIYIDKTCEAITISDNSVYSQSTGGLIKINFGNKNNTITGNVLCGGVYGVTFGNDGVNYVANVGNVFTGNVVATGFYPVSWRDLNSSTTYNPFSSGGTTNNNFYLNPYGDVVGRRLGNAAALTYTLAAWRTYTGGDGASVGNPVALIVYAGSFATEQEMIVQLNETMSPVSFAVPTGYVDKSGTTAGNNVTIPAYGSVCFIKTASVATVYDTFTGTNGTSISGRTPNVGGNWVLRNGAITITSNAMVSASSGNATETTSNTDANVYVNASKGTTGNINILLRHNGSNGTSVEDYVWLFWGTDLISVIEHVGSTGVNTTLATAPQELAASTLYHVSAQIVGNRIKVRVNNEQRIDFTGLTMNPSSVIHGFRQTVTGSSNTTTFAISSP